MHDHEYLGFLSSAFIAESAFGNFDKAKKIAKMVSENELIFLLGHVCFEIHQFIHEMFPDDESQKKCNEFV